MNSETLAHEEKVAECAVASDVAAPRLLSTAVDSDAARDRLITLARTLGRQAARRHLHRGYSLLEIALCLTLGALVVAALWYDGILNLLLGHR